jgi:hypothetical protein
MSVKLVISGPTIVVPAAALRLDKAQSCKPSQVWLNVECTYPPDDSVGPLEPRLITEHAAAGSSTTHIDGKPERLKRGSGRSECMPNTGVRAAVVPPRGHSHAGFSTGQPTRSTGGRRTRIWLTCACPIVRPTTRSPDGGRLLIDAVSGLRGQGTQFERAALASHRSSLGPAGLDIRAGGAAHT